ncbi:hypothetical protein K1720_07555 [Thermococcus argininiproducens]|uniref:Uncharacterized protein n=1 Tax=Thermococcus argininiproducens TaxID=2866384 RepID=A0A9E7SC35_9EURY|nr:hypothetical protein [Thermococcus argininiproducens]USG99380.1 hypothetical protein K1720_07555 [Thermococcus argininiproducens]
MKRRKIGSSKSKDGFRYPVLRLPREFEWLIGKEVEIEFRTRMGTPELYKKLYNLIIIREILKTE